jgi:hypothetical protein
MSVQAVSSGTGYDASAMAQSLIKKIDTNNDSSISKSEFSTALSKANSKSSSNQDSVNLFSYLDANSDNAISQSELELFLKKLSTAASSSNSSSPTSSQNGTAASSGAGGGGDGGGGVSSMSSTSGSSTSLTYDVRDTNQDGVVSPQEILAYEAKHPSTETNSQNLNPSNSQYQNAINQYQQNAMSKGLQDGFQNQFSLSG